MDDPLAVAVRWLLYAALGSSFGLAGFGWHALPAADRPAWSRSIRALLGLLVATSVLASAGGIGILASRMLGIPLPAVDAEALAMLLELPGLSIALGLRLGSLLLAATMLLVAPRQHGLLVAALAVALATLAWSGHAAATEGALSLPHLGSAVLHLWGAGLWLGAIAAFLLLAGRAAHNPEARALLADALARFPKTGTAIVLLLAVSGFANMVLIVGMPGLPATLRVPWGQLMALKLAAFAGMLGLAALNRFRLAPALAMPHKPSAAIARSLRLELALALLILGLVAWLGLLSPTGE